MNDPISLRARFGIRVLLAYDGTAWLNAVNIADATTQPGAPRLPFSDSVTGLMPPGMRPDQRRTEISQTHW